MSDVKAGEALDVEKVETADVRVLGAKVVQNAISHGLESEIKTSKKKLE